MKQSQKNHRLSYCSPIVLNNKNGTSTGVCLNRQGLLHFIRKYNLQHQNSIKFTNQMSDGELVKLIREKMEGNSGPCSGKSGDWCWADQPCVAEDQFIQSYYKPRIPKTRYQWLKTSDIDQVLKPYELVYPEFKYLGTVPLDFDKLRDFRFSNLNYCSLYQNEGKTKIGAVFNLDTSNKAGSHWVSMFADLEQNYVAFFDSVGVQNPPKEISQLMKSIKRQLERCAHQKLRKYVANNMDLRVNTRNIQKGNSECGVFSIYFILTCLDGKTPDEIFNDPYLTDKTVNYFRGQIFRPSIDSDCEWLSERDV